MQAVFFVSVRSDVLWGFLALTLIGSLSGLASQLTARQGNILGVLGVGAGILASLAAVGFPPAVLAQFAGVAGAGSLIGKFRPQNLMPRI